MNILKYQMMDASSSHITESDADLLTNGETDVIAHAYEFGWLVMIDPELDGELLYGYSDAFQNLYKIAYAGDCQYLLLDADAKIYDELPQFDW